MALRLAALAVLVSTLWLAPAPARADAPPGMKPELAKYYAEEEPTIELVTMGIGALIWERHGHIALCLRYQNSRRDVCYNYGIADFHKPLSMAWGFFRGTQSFWVGKIPAESMLRIYEDADRTVWVQPLPLTPAQKKQVIEKLEHDILDANRYYAYDHFIDNCTTRVRDIIDDAVGGELKAMAATVESDGKTFRDLAREGFYGMRLPLLITDIAMGRSTDRVPTYWEKMFLPQYLREAVLKKWGMEPYVRYERVGPPPLDDGPSGRWIFALVILLLTAPAWATRLWGRFERTGLALAVVPYVFLGSVLAFLAIISPLPYVRSNETCLMLFPLDVLLLVGLSPERRRLYARGRVAMLVLVGLLQLIGVLVQPLTAPLLWPLIPCAVVGFWPPKEDPVDDAKEALKDGEADKGKLARSVPPTNKKKRPHGKSGKKR